MTTRTHRFPAPGTAPELEIRNASGTVTVEAQDGAAEVLVEVEPLDPSAEAAIDRVQVSATEGRVRVTAMERRLFRSPSFAVRVVTPSGADTRVESASADIALHGRLGRVQVGTASGDAVVEECAGLKMRTASGDGRIGQVAGHVTVGTASGDITVGSTGDGMDARTASGDVSLGESAGDVTIGTASGDVTIGAVLAGAVRVRTASGDVEVGVAPGLRVWLDLSSTSGRMDSQLAEEGPEEAGGTEPATVSLSLHSMSGGLRVRRAATAP